jgi:hypothetical protein
MITGISQGSKFPNQLKSAITPLPGPQINVSSDRADEPSKILGRSMIP